MTIYNGGLYVSGGMTVLGDISFGSAITATTASDRRLKTNVIPLKNSLDKVSKIRGVYFSWAEDGAVGKKLSDGHRHVGVIAQEVKDVLPEVVREIEGGQYLGVQYNELIPLLLDAVRELDEKVNRNGVEPAQDILVLRRQLQSLFLRVDVLEKELSMLKREKRNRL